MALRIAIIGSSGHFVHVLDEIETMSEAEVVGLANGAMATVSLDYLRPQAAATHGDDWLRIVGSKGIIDAGMDRNQCTIATDEQPLRELPQLSSKGYYAPFLTSLAASGPGRPGPATRISFSLTHAALCARAAADTGSVVTIRPQPWSDNHGVTHHE
ncbi:MAG: hypothetical protein ACYTGH_01895 [Planctomycetota bacterium]|jgi:hypothetical protein